MADDMLVMSQGEIVERGLAEDIYRNPQHPTPSSCCRPFPVGWSLGQRRRIVILKWLVVKSTASPRGMVVLSY